MTETPDMQQLLDHGEQFARHLLLERGDPELMPMYHLMSDDNSVIMGCPWANEDEKLGMVEIVKAKSREMGATMAVFMAEAWVAKSPEGLSREQAEAWAAETIPPSQRPDHTEIVQIAVTDGTQIEMRILEIKRNEGGKIIELEAPPPEEGPQMFMGRLIDGIIKPKQTH